MCFSITWGALLFCNVYKIALIKYSFRFPSNVIYGHTQNITKRRMKHDN